MDETNEPTKTFEEIKQDFRSKSGNAKSIEEGFKWTGILVSILLMISGCISFARGNSTWGTIVLLVGLIGLIYKLAVNISNRN